MKHIEGYEGQYSITSDGKVWSYTKKYGHGNPLRKGRWLKPNLSNRGYLRINLFKNKKYKTLSIHRLVAQTYLPNPNNKLEINHKNLIKTDNRVENIEWVDHKYNVQHAWRLGAFDNRNNSGENNGKAKLTWKEVNEMRENHIPRNGIMKREPWKQYGISNVHYYKILNNKSWYDPKYKKEKNK